MSVTTSASAKATLSYLFRICNLTCAGNSASPITLSRKCRRFAATIFAISSRRTFTSFVTSTTSFSGADSVGAMTTSTSGLTSTFTVSTIGVSTITSSASNRSGRSTFSSTNVNSSIAFNSSASSLVEAMSDLTLPPAAPFVTASREKRSSIAST